MNTILFILFSGFLAEILGTIAGFGSSSIFLPFVAQVLDFHNALILAAIYHIFWNTSRLILFHQYVNKHILILFGIPSILCTILGAMLVTYIDQNVLKGCLGIILVVFAGYSLLGHTWKVKPRPLFGLIGGGLSGFSAGLIGTGGVLRGASMSLFHLPKEQYIATIASIALLVDVTRIPIYFGNGFLVREFWILLPFLALIAFIGSYVGRKMVKLLPEKVFQKIILVSIMIFAGIMAYQGFDAI